MYYTVHGPRTVPCLYFQSSCAKSCPCIAKGISLVCCVVLKNVDMFFIDFLMLFLQCLFVYFFCCREPHYTILPCTVKLMLQSILWSREHMSTAKMKTMLVLCIVQGQPRNASFNCLVVIKIVVVSKFHPSASQKIGSLYIYY